MESAYYARMDLDGGEHWGDLRNMHSIEPATPGGEVHQFVLKTAAYRSRCHDEFTARIDIDIAAGVTLQFMQDGFETHFFTGPYAATDMDVTWTGRPNATLTVVYDTTGLPVSNHDNGFEFKQYHLGSSSGACSPVVQLNSRTARVALAGAGAGSDLAIDINAISGAELFPVEADGPLQHQAPPPSTMQPSSFATAGSSTPTADPWMSDHTTSLRNLMDCDPTGATCSDPSNGGSPKAFSRHGGGHPNVVILQIDTNLNSEAMLATGDHRLPSLWFHNDGVSNQNPAGGSSTACQPYGTCAPHPEPSHDNHGNGVSAWFSTLVNGNGFNSLTPNSTYWFAGTGLDFNDLSIAVYEIAVSDIIARLGEMNPDLIDVISLSFGTSVPSIAMATAIGDYTDKGVLFVAAAGNEASEFAIFPANASSVIGVGSTGTYDLVPTGLPTFSDIDELSTFYYPFPGTWASNKGGDIVMAGAGPNPEIARYKCELSGLPCINDEDCFDPVSFPDDTCTDQDNVYEQSVGMGTSHSTPQIAALLANTIADVLYVNPQDYPQLHAALGILQPDEAKLYLSQVVKAALFQSAERWFPSVELPHDEFGYGRGDHMAIMEFMIASEQANSTPDQYTVHATDIERSLFTKDSTDTTWEDLEPDRMGMVGSANAAPTRTTFRAGYGLSVGSCWRILNPYYALGGVIGEPLKVEVEDPYITHDTMHFRHDKSELPANVLVEFAFQQRLEVEIPTKRWGLLECLLPWFFSPTEQSFYSIVEQVDTDPSVRESWSMQYSLDGFGYNHDMSDLTILANPPLKPYEITPACCSFAEVMSETIEEEMADFDQFLRTYLLPSVRIEAMDMVETALDAHLAYNRLTPQKYWMTRFGNAHPSWTAPQFQHWLPGGAPLGAEHRNQNLAPLYPLSSVQKVPVLRPVLDPGEDSHLYDPYPSEIPSTDPLLEPVSESERWDDVSYQSVNTIREQWNQADLNDAHEPGGFNEFYTTPNAKVSDMKVRVTNLRQRDVRPDIRFFSQPTSLGHYGRIISEHEADLWTCANDPLDRPPENILPEPVFDCVAEYHGTFRFEMTFWLERNDWYAAYPLSEKGLAGPDHHFENRLTADPEATTVAITMNPPGLPWWGTGTDPCDDISDPHEIGRGCALTKAEAEAVILGIYEPTMTRLVDSMSFDRFGVNADLGPDYLTLMRQLDFLQSYLGLMYDFVFDGYDWDLGAMDGTFSSPPYELIEQPGFASSMVHKLQLDRAPANERKDNDPDEELEQPSPPPTGATLEQEGIEVKDGRCTQDNSIACDDDSQCGGGANSCVSLRYCSWNGAPPSSYPLTTCTEANIATDCGSSGGWECNRVPSRMRYADRAEVSVGNTAAQSSASINESYFTPYIDGGTSVFVDSDLWLAMEGAPSSIFAVGLEPSSSLRKPDPDPPEFNFVVDGVSRHEKSLVRSDTCLWRANMLFTYDRWAPCPAGEEDCSETFQTRHTGYSLTPTRSNWDGNPEDPSCGGGGGPGPGGVSKWDDYDDHDDDDDEPIPPWRPDSGDPPSQH